MGRKTKTVVATYGRDKDKAFTITEMPSYQAADWALRAALALTNAGANLPDDFLSGGMASIASVGFRALLGIRHFDAKPLLDELLACVQYRPKDLKIAAQPLTFDDGSQIEEALTWGFLHSEVFELHTGFSAADWFRNMRAKHSQINQPA